MSTQYLGEFISYGKNIHIDIKRRNIDYSKRELKKATIEIIQVIEDFVNEVYIEMVEENLYKGLSEYPYVFAPFFSTKTFVKMKDLINSSDISFTEAFNKAVIWFMKNEKFNIFSYMATNDNKEELVNLTISIKERAMKIVHRYFIHKYANLTDENVIISINKFEKEYFYQLPKNVTGFVCRNIDDEILIKDMAFAYEIPIVVTQKNVSKSGFLVIDNINKKLFVDPNAMNLTKCMEQYSIHNVDVLDKPKYKSDIIKYYASLVDLRHLNFVKQNNWYVGGIFFRTEYVYLSKGYFPKHDELVDMFVKLMEAFYDREIHIQLPELNHYKKLDYETDEIYTEVNQVSAYHRIYFRTVNAIYEASQKTGKQTTLVIPMLRVGREIFDWKDKIDCFIGIDRDHDIVLKFGIAMETESAFEYFEDYRRVHSIVFGMDNFLEEALEISKYDKVDYDYFMRAAWPDLQMTHQFYRKNGIRMLHMVSGHILRDPFYLRKFIVKGLKHFVIPLKTLKTAENVLHLHESTRGKYIGVHAERKRAKSKE
jgi:hypothetical protein